MLIKNIVSLVKEYPPVRPKKQEGASGKKPIHSWEKLVCICILMVVFGSTYRNIQNVVPSTEFTRERAISRLYLDIEAVHLRRYL